ncbi:histidine phosphotransferase family protein [Sphingomonas sp.]|uniref:histidine phosphotransferase family protein n=1 Tax=Sphingomonas sp. TaxID=28214 RepID=UPI003AFF988C
MPITPADFASLLCSRLCHDLLSPVGALNNGLELLADETDPAMRQRCLDLLSESAKTSANKLKFFRLAFGAAGGFGEQVDARECRAAIEGLLSSGRKVELGWLVEADTLPKPAAKVLLNLAMIAGDALVRGGRLDIGGEVGGEENGGQVEIVVRAEGPRVILDPDIRRTLSDGEGDEAVTPRVAAALLIHTLAGSVQVSEPGDNVMLFGAAWQPPTSG